MKKAILWIFAIIFYFAAAQKHNFYENAKYSGRAVSDETSSRYLRALPKVVRDDGEQDKAVPTEDIVYNKALLKKVVKKLRDYINQIIEMYNLEVIKTEEEEAPKSHKESHSNDKKDHHNSAATKADEEVLEKSEDNPKHHHKNTTEELSTELEKEDVQDEDLSEKCAHYEKHHHHNDKTHSKADSSKTKDDDAEFDDTYSERFLRNIPFDRINDEDNFQ